MIIGELMIIEVISIFPEMFNIIYKYGITKKAIEKGLLFLRCWNLRSFSNKNRNIDDKPYGGGPGMILMAEPLKNAIHKIKSENKKDMKVIYLSPQGTLLNHKNIKKILKHENIIIICGRYKGIDERIILKEVDEEWSIGDYILTGGELAAMIIIDSISRLIPGVLNNIVSIKEDSFSYKLLLDYPNYTRPRTIYNICVPSVLVKGNHNKIKEWRLKQSLGKTWIKRPEILKDLNLTKEENILLKEFQNELIS